MLPAVADDLLMWGEWLAAKKAHRDVTGGIAEVSADMAKLGADMVRLTRRFRQLYAGQLAQESSGVTPLRVA